jgi:hypothetical protein
MYCSLSITSLKSFFPHDATSLLIATFIYPHISVPKLDIPIPHNSYIFRVVAVVLTNKLGVVLRALLCFD